MGRLGAPWGIKGWLHVTPQTETEDSLFDYDVWYLSRGDAWTPFVVEEGRFLSKTMVIKLEGVDDRDQAGHMRGMMIAVPRSQFPEPEADSYYWADLIGLAVVNQQGEALGTVKELLQTGANDILVVTRDEREQMIPFVGAIVTAVQLEQGQIVVDWGLDY